MSSDELMSEASEQEESDSGEEIEVRRRGARRGRGKRGAAAPSIDQDSPSDEEDVDIETGATYDRLKPTMRDAVKGLGDLNNKCVESFEKVFSSAELAAELFEDDPSEYKEQCERLTSALDHLIHVQQQALIEKNLYEALSHEIGRGVPGMLRDWKWKDELANRRDQAAERQREELEKLAHSKKSDLEEYLKREGSEEADDEKQRDDESDDDLVVERAEPETRCPITQMELEHPVKNKTCRHIFEREAIEDQFKALRPGRPGVSCPVQGCSALFSSMDDFQRDIRTEKHIRRMRRRLEENEVEQQDVLDLTMPVDG